MLPVLVPFNPIKVEAAIREIAHGPFSPRPLQIRKINVAYRQSFDILRGLRSDAVAREGKIARC